MQTEELTDSTESANKPTARPPSGTRPTATSPAKSAEEARVRGRGSVIILGMLFAFVVAIAAIVFIAQNTTHVPIEFLSWDISVPLVVPVFGAAVVAVGVSALAYAIWHRSSAVGRRHHTPAKR